VRLTVVPQAKHDGRGEESGEKGERAAGERRCYGREAGEGSGIQRQEWGKVGMLNGGGGSARGRLAAEKRMRSTSRTGKAYTRTAKIQRELTSINREGTGSSTAEWRKGVLPIK